MENGDCVAQKSASGHTVQASRCIPVHSEAALSFSSNCFDDSLPEEDDHINQQIALDQAETSAQESDEEMVHTASCCSITTIIEDDSISDTLGTRAVYAPEEHNGVPWLGDGYNAVEILSGALCIPQSEILLGHPLYTDGTQSIIWHASVPKAFGRAILVAKLALSEDDVPDLFQEAIFLRAAEHPGLVELKGIVVADQDRSFQGFVMEYVEGEDLFVLLNRYRAKGCTLPPMTVLHIVHQLAQTLLHLHDCGITHHDLKLENIVVSGNLSGKGSPPKVKLLDLGMSLTHAESKRMIGLRGSLPYMAPELLQSAINPTSFEGVVSPAIDVWALGVLVWEMATGCSAYAEKGRWEVVQGVASGSLALDSEACGDSRLSWIVKGCLVRNASDRMGLDEIVNTVLQWCSPEP